MVAKELGFNLLNPPDPVKSQINIPISPAVRCRHERCLLKESNAKVQNLHKLVHCELLLHFEEHKAKFNMIPHTISDCHIIGNTKTRIEQLATESRLKKLDIKLKMKYADWFPSDIPHVHDLPSDVYHHIDVKPGVAISTAHGYSCPQKYREG